MADFFTTRGVSFLIDELIKKGRKHIYLVTPYLKFSETLYERLSTAIKNNVQVTLIYGKEELNSKQNALLHTLDCSIYYKKNLHAKCYLNENEAIISSMNLHSFSEVNNVEMGISISTKDDLEAYTGCYNEVLDIIQNSTPIKEVNSRAETKIAFYGEPQFTLFWHDLLKRSYPEVDFSLNENKIEAKHFPLPNMTFSNAYGFATIEIDDYNTFSMSLKNSLVDIVYRDLDKYRCYWEHPFSKIFLYKAENINFKSLNEDLEYCLTGLEILISKLKS